MKKNIWVLLALVLGLVGCSVESQPISMGVENLSLFEVGASEGSIDKSNPEWMEKYCKEELMRTAMSPVRFDRQRGPFKSFSPVYWPERYESGVASETCDTDFYIWPVREEAFGDVGVVYAYSSGVWEEFYQAVIEQITQELDKAGWRVVGHKDEEGEPDLILERYRPEESLSEYLDVFFTKDEEFVFELLVVDKEYK